MQKFLFALLASIAVSPVYANIVNASFEDWENQEPVGWTKIDDGIDVARSTSVTLDGNTSARVTVTTRTQARTDLRQTINVVAGETYLFAASVYHTEGSVRARLYVDGYRGYSFPQLIGEWQTVSYEYTASSTGDIEVGLRFYDRAGFDGRENVYVDNFLPGIEIPETPAPNIPGTSGCQQNDVNISLTTDRYGSETSWELLDDSGKVIASGTGFENNTEYAENLCLQDGDYTFNITDTYGDGICCNYGAGSYAITANGETLVSGGEFNAFERKTFSIRKQGPTDPNPSLDPYYSSAENLRGFELKTALHEIINDHTVRGYRALWGFYGDIEIDLYFEKDGSILDIYSENPNGNESYIYTAINDQCGSFRREGDCYNREHSFPRSWFGGEREPMNSDVHHIFLTDGFVNSERGSHPYGEVSNTTFTSRNGSKVGLSNARNGYSGFVFEPIDEFKGDLARAQFYMATRYEDIISTWASNSNNADAVLERNNRQVFEDWYLDLLLQWHKQDPVSQKEIDRNNAAFDYQGNRNPYIDVPEFAELIWLR